VSADEEGDAAAVVLVVEDEWEILDILREILEAEGFVVLTASHGRDALALIERVPRIDAVLTDLMMPVMDGFDLVRAMAAHDRYRSIPILVMTAATPDADGLRELAIERLLRKPLRLDHLVDEVRRLTRT
jgi:CheY-like chemotaxis protein